MQKCAQEKNGLTPLFLDLEYATLDSLFVYFNFPSENVSLKKKKSELVWTGFIYQTFCSEVTMSDCCRLPKLKNYTF